MMFCFYSIKQRKWGRKAWGRRLNEPAVGAWDWPQCCQAGNCSRSCSSCFSCSSCSSCYSWLTNLVKVTKRHLFGILEGHNGNKHNVLMPIWRIFSLCNRELMCLLTVHLLALPCLRPHPVLTLSSPNSFLQKPNENVIYSVVGEESIQVLS